MIPYVNKDHYIKHDDNMLMVYFRKNIKGNRTNDRGDIVNVFCYMLNALSCELDQNPDLEELSITITQDEANQIISHNMITDKNKRINNINAVKDVLFEQLDNVKIINLDNSKYSRVIPYFQHVAYNHELLEVEIKFNSEFIEYFKGVKDLKSNYSKVTADIMISLGTLNAKIVFSYICRYVDQINKFGCTNLTSIDKLKQCLDKNYKVKNGKMVFKLRNNDLEVSVETAMNQINQLIANKNEVYGLNLPQYKIEWYRDTNYGEGIRNGELTKFKIRLANEDELVQPTKNESKPKEKNKKVSNSTSKDTFSELKKLKNTNKPKKDNPKKKAQTCEEMYNLVEAALQGEEVELNVKLITGWYLHLYYKEVGREHGGQFKENIGKIKNINTKFHLDDNWINVAKHIDSYISKYKKEFKGFPTLADFTTEWVVKEVLGQGGKKQSYMINNNDYIPDTRARRVTGLDDCKPEEERFVAGDDIF